MSIVLALFLLLGSVSAKDAFFVFVQSGTSISLLETPGQVDGTFAECLDLFPEGAVPVISGATATPRCIKTKPGPEGVTTLYATHFNNIRHIPDFVAYSMDASVLGTISRANHRFSWRELGHVDDSAWSPVYEPMSRGHLRALAHSNKDLLRATATFTYMNIMPTYSDFDGGVWSRWEDSLRAYVQNTNAKLFVILGPSLEGSTQYSRRIINGKRPMLTHFLTANGKEVQIAKYVWSVIYDPSAGSALGVVCTNAADWTKDHNKAPVDQAAYECDTAKNVLLANTPLAWRLGLIRSSKNCQLDVIKENIEYNNQNPLKCEYKTVEDIAAMLKFDPLPAVKDKAIRTNKKPWAAFEKYAAMNEQFYLRDKSQLSKPTPSYI